jgi:hypothetical protein
MTPQQDYQEWHDALLQHVGDYLERTSALPALAEIMDVWLTKVSSIEENDRRQLMSVYHLMAFLSEIRDIHQLMIEAKERGGQNYE